MRIEDIPMATCETTFPWIMDPEGTRSPCMRLHHDGNDPDNDIIVPLNKDLAFQLIGDISQVYLQLTGNEEPPFDLVEAAPPCEWPLCLTGEQGALLAEEIRQEDLTGESCTIYLDKYPQDQREICGCTPKGKDDTTR